MQTSAVHRSVVYWFSIQRLQR